MKHLPPFVFRYSWNLMPTNPFGFSPQTSKGLARKPQRVCESSFFLSFTSGVCRGNFVQEKGTICLTKEQDYGFKI